MTVPNFIIFGVGKAGTSSLHNYLGQHPAIFMSPEKEPNYFLYSDLDDESQLPSWHKQSIIDLDAYERLFSTVHNETAIGESSISYFADEAAGKRIRGMIPDCKLIAVLRQPVDRAYSAYLMWHRDGFDPAPTFEEALELDEVKEGSSLRPPTPYRGLMAYTNKLAAYHKIFPKEQIKILLYDDLNDSPKTFFQQIFKFLEVDATFEPDLTRRENTAGVHSSRFIAALLGRPNPIRYLTRTFLPDNLRSRLRRRALQHSLKPPPQLSPQLRSTLTKQCEGEILALQDLIGRDLSHWLHEKPKI